MVGGGQDLSEVPAGSLRARAILIRQASVRAAIVLALTLSLHFITGPLSEGPPGWGRGGGGGVRGGRWWWGAERPLSSSN